MRCEQFARLAICGSDPARTIHALAQHRQRLVNLAMRSQRLAI
jgi:hypothetical protein